MVDEKRSKILLTEYQEGGQRCRAFEQLIRLSMAAYLAFSGTICGIIYASNTSRGTRIALSVIGALVSALLANSLIRLRRYFTCYMDRLKEIERELGMKLYNNGDGCFDRNPEIGISTAIFWKNLIKDCSRFPIPNKIAFLLIYIVGAIFFLIKSVCC